MPVFYFGSPALAIFISLHVYMYNSDSWRELLHANTSIWSNETGFLGYVVAAVAAAAQDITPIVRYWINKKTKIRNQSSSAAEAVKKYTDMSNTERANYLQENHEELQAKDCKDAFIEMVCPCLFLHPRMCFSISPSTHVFLYFSIHACVSLFLHSRMCFAISHSRMCFSISVV